MNTIVAHENVELIKQELDRVLRSPEFANVARLREFLSYIVTESGAGRQDLILGKTIAQDVYGRGADIDGKGLSLVKVDAGRLRRRLDEYYAGSGSGDPVRIVVHRGGYAPSFEEVETETPDVSAPKLSALLNAFGGWVWVVVFGLVVLVATYLWNQDQSGLPDTRNSDARAIAVRQSLRAKSTSALQAVNLSEQARGLIFPPMDPKRLQATLDMFERAIELDAEYFGGYAGAAQVLGMLALLSPPGDVSDTLVAAAQQRAERAVALRPDSSWSQSAFAWVSFAARDFDHASKVSRQAVALDPTDYDALEFEGLIALFNGEFERARQSTDPAQQKGRVGTRFVFRNIYAAASFHLGQYNDTINFFNDAAEQGDPISQLSVAYLAAAHYQLGNTKQAADLVRDFETSWPNGRIDLILGRTFRDQSFVDAVIDPFKSAGWSPG